MFIVHFLGSKFRGPLSEAILKLQETGVLQRLKDRWWKQKGGGQCIAKPAPALIELGLQNLGGVFVVLLVGSLFAISIGICEFMFKSRLSNVDKVMTVDGATEQHLIIYVLFVIVNISKKSLGRFKVCFFLLGNH